MRQYLIWFISLFFFYFQLFHLIRLWNYWRGKRLTILMFHRISDNKSGDGKGVLPTISISEDNFEALIRFISKYYKVISVNDYLRKLKKQSCLPYSGIIISFDDGYKETMENVLPLMQKYELPAILFVPTAIIDNGGSFWWDQIYSMLSNTQNSMIRIESANNPVIVQHLFSINRVLSEEPHVRQRAIIELIEALQNCQVETRNFILEYLLRYDARINRSPMQSVLNWHQIRTLQSSGFEIGSHTVNHQFLPTVSSQEASDELVFSKRKIEAEIKTNVSCFSYPGGKYDDNTVKLVEKAGYVCAFTTDEGINTLKCDKYKLKRINISDENVLNPKGEFSKSITAWRLFLK